MTANHLGPDGHAPLSSTPSATPQNIGLEVEADVAEPIAIVGFSLKYPQDADSPASFWKMLEEKRCAMTEWPKDRINLEAFYHRDGDREDSVRNPAFMFMAIL